MEAIKKMFDWLDPKTRRKVELTLAFLSAVFVALLIGNFIVEKEIAYIDGITKFCEGKDGIYNISITYHGFDVEAQNVNCTVINEEGITLISSNGGE